MTTVNVPAPVLKLVTSIRPVELTVAEPVLAHCDVPVVINDDTIVVPALAVTRKLEAQLAPKDATVKARRSMVLMLFVAAGILMIVIGDF